MIHARMNWSFFTSFWSPQVHFVNISGLLGLCCLMSLDRWHELAVLVPKKYKNWLSASGSLIPSPKGSSWPEGLGSGASETEGGAAASYGPVEWFFGVLIHHSVFASSFIVDSGCCYPRLLLIFNKCWATLRKQPSTESLCHMFWTEICRQVPSERKGLSSSSSFSPASRLWREDCKSPVNTCIS